MCCVKTGLRGHTPILSVPREAPSKDCLVIYPGQLSILSDVSILNMLLCVTNVYGYMCESYLLPLFERTFRRSLDYSYELKSLINCFFALSFCGDSSVSFPISSIRYYFSSLSLVGCTDLFFFFRLLVAS